MAAKIECRNNVLLAVNDLEGDFYEIIESC